jgi:hypothetical protein
LYYLHCSDALAALLSFSWLKGCGTTGNYSR